MPYICIVCGHNQSIRNQEVRKFVRTMPLGRGGNTQQTTSLHDSSRNSFPLLYMTVGAANAAPARHFIMHTRMRTRDVLDTTSRRCHCHPQRAATRLARRLLLGRCFARSCQCHAEPSISIKLSHTYGTRHVATPARDAGPCWGLPQQPPWHLTTCSVHPGTRRHVLTSRYAHTPATVLAHKTVRPAKIPRA